MSVYCSSFVTDDDTPDPGILEGDEWIDIDAAFFDSTSVRLLAWVAQRWEGTKSKMFIIGQVAESIERMCARRLRWFTVCLSRSMQSSSIPVPNPEIL